MPTFVPVLCVQVYCCLVAVAQSLSEHDDASEMVGDHVYSAIFSWQALPGKGSSVPGHHLSPCLDLWYRKWDIKCIIYRIQHRNQALRQVVDDHYHE